MARRTQYGLLLAAPLFLSGCVTISSSPPALHSASLNADGRGSQVAQQPTGIEVELSLPSVPGFASKQNHRSSSSPPATPSLAAGTGHYVPRHEKLAQQQARILELESQLAQRTQLAQPVTPEPPQPRTAQASASDTIQQADLAADAESVWGATKEILTSTHTSSRRNETQVAGLTVADTPRRFLRQEPADAEATEVAPLPPATHDSLSLEHFEGLAMGNHPALSEAMAQVRAERGRWVQAGLAPNPHVGFSGQQVGSGGEAEQIGVYLGQTWVRGNKLSLDQAVAARKIRVAEQRVNRIRLAVQSQVRRAYYALAIAHRRQTLTQSLVEIASENVRLTQILFENQEIGQVDVLREKMQLEMVATEFENSKADVAAAIVQLQAVLGISVPELEDETALAQLSESLPQATELSVEIDRDAWSSSHPDLAIAAFEIEAARWSIEREQAQRVADLDLQMVYQYDESTDSSNGNLQITGPLQLWNKNQGAIQASYAELSAARQKYQKVELLLDQKFARAFADFEKSRERVLRYSQEGGILQMSRSTVELLEKGVELGELNRLSLFLAQRERMVSELKSLDALSEALDKKAQLESLLVADDSLN